MQQLDLNYINSHAPYSVNMRTEQVYFFKTDVGMLSPSRSWMTIPFGKQELRSRLFVRWFNTYSGRDTYIMKTAEVKEGKTKNFAALIIQKDNPRVEKIIAEFDETISILTNKPNEQ